MSGFMLFLHMGYWFHFTSCCELSVCPMDWLRIHFTMSPPKEHDLLAHTELAHWLYDRCSLSVLWMCCTSMNLHSLSVCCHLSFFVLQFTLLYYLLNMKHPAASAAVSTNSVFTPGGYCSSFGESYIGCSGHEEWLLNHLKKTHVASDSGPCVGYLCKFLRDSASSYGASLIARLASSSAA